MQAGTELSAKKKRTEEAGETDKTKDETKEFESTEFKHGEQEQENDYDGDGTYGSGLYYENMEEPYSYEHDYGYDEYDWYRYLRRSRLRASVGCR